jgi:hypothetical protein
MRLTMDLGAGVEQTGDDGRIDFGHIALEERRTIHHRHAGKQHVVLESDGLAGELSGRRTLDHGLLIPGVERVLRRRRLMARGAGIFGDRQRVGGC